MIQQVARNFVLDKVASVGVVSELLAGSYRSRTGTVSKSPKDLFSPLLFWSGSFPVYLHECRIKNV